MQVDSRTGPTSQKVTELLRNAVAQLALNCVVLVILAVVITEFLGPAPILQRLRSGPFLPLQLALGAGLGSLLSALTFRTLVPLSAFRELRESMIGLMARLPVGGWNPLWLGLLAGTGEETLFRGALQPLIGIWWTSLAFSLLHVVNVRHSFRRALQYIVSVFCMSVLVGTLFLKFGLVTAIAFHASWDMVAILSLRKIAHQSGRTADVA